MVSLRDDGMIYIVDPEVFDLKSAQLIVNDTAKYAKQLRAENKPVLVLIDASQVRETHGPVKKYITQAVTTLDFDLMATFGTDHLHTMITNFILLAARMINQKSVYKLKIFETEEAAEQWLKAFVRPLRGVKH